MIIEAKTSSKWIAINTIVGIVSLAVLSGCVSSSLALPKIKQEITTESYLSNQDKGLIVLSVAWWRTWKCAQFENAQLRAFGFDRLPTQTMTDDGAPEIFIEGSQLYAERQPVNYVLAVDPGEYALTEFTIKAASSVTDLEIGKVGRSKLFDGGKPVGGTFKVKAGELVYIGHFGLDCYKEPLIWRYYVEGQEGFERYKKSIKRQYFFLKVDGMQFQLFKTAVFGRDYELGQ